VRRRDVRAGLVVQLVLLGAATLPVAAAATPVSGPHETIDSRYTTTRPNAPSGFSFSGTYHAAGDPSGYPPYMRKMVFYNRAGARYDTSVPERCSASDVELAAFGAAACPPGSRLGGGTTKTSFMGSSPTSVDVDFFNNSSEQIILARSPLLATVARGRIYRDGSVEFASPTCYPSLQPVGCPVDDVLQLESTINLPAYTRTVGGRTRSWLTMPRTCPASRHWDGPVRLWWADGTVDTVITSAPCTRAGGRRASVRRRAMHRPRRRGRRARPHRRRD
jgi:hypothetical protein